MRKGFQVALKRFTLDFRNNFFMESLFEHWNGLFREVVECLPLEGFKRHVDVATGTRLSDGTQKVRLMVGFGGPIESGDPEDLSQAR